MRSIPGTPRLAWLPTAALVTLVAAACSSGPPGATRQGPGVGRVTKISQSCHPYRRFGNAEVELASDLTRGLVYAEWIGCGGIGFARSADGATTWSPPSALPPTFGKDVWDPAIVVGRTGTVYAAYMTKVGPDFYPVVDISTDRGATWQVHRLGAPHPANFGDRDFIAVGRTGEIYLTWDYGPAISPMRERCFRGGSCAFTAGDPNIVLQKSTDGGRTWSKPTPVAPGFPASGSVSAPILIGPGGRLDVLFERYRVVNPRTLAIGSGHDYFTSSADDGKTWSAPVRLGPASATLGRGAWWIDGSLGIDSAGNLYATWDTQSGGTDKGWLAYSKNGGRTWSAPLAVTSGSGEATNIVQVLGASPGIAYVGLLTDSSGSYAASLRPFSITGGWASAPIQVSQLSGIASIWPGDTIGLAPDGGVPGVSRVAVSWGGAPPSSTQSSIWAATVGGLP